MSVSASFVGACVCVAYGCGMQSVDWHAGAAIYYAVLSCDTSILASGSTMHYYHILLVFW